ncbi:hypothetical protein CPC735_009200 [Coccidioides posadasii C735 delta SOWgp]|uniref:Uncharacterized protein n=1 Tax=Coccidioides posadasii (strain C735) TaxID=222929 RepID=C5PAI2_COCP7|nr:hypothetical protein CPC735_009200 [Coccidioides posadasii C735 delta SOWgp]EER26744.1 hypothetical protein CPC735_009200 [Coccidioides posadasii C735 delta SOWgp]|eukprot:XP_003068889.1 hypothetical protein CPC735_009200 [Coccidioides posadasii C735 delta SOWgp]
MADDFDYNGINDAFQALSKASPLSVQTIADLAMMGTGKFPDLIRTQRDFNTNYNMIESSLRDACRDIFREDFGYEYNGNDIQGPPKVEFQAFFSCGTTSPSTIDNYIKQSIIENMPIPESTQIQVAVGLSKFISTLLVPGQDGIVYTKYQKSFPLPSDSDPSSSFDVNAVISFYDLELPEDAPNPNEVFLVYFCGLGLFTKN